MGWTFYVQLGSRGKYSKHAAFPVSQDSPSLRLDLHRLMWSYTKTFMTCICRVFPHRIASHRFAPSSMTTRSSVNFLSFSQHFLLHTHRALEQRLHSLIYRYSEQMWNKFAKLVKSSLKRCASKFYDKQRLQWNWIHWLILIEFRNLTSGKSFNYKFLAEWAEC